MVVGACIDGTSVSALCETTANAPLGHDILYPLRTKFDSTGSNWSATCAGDAPAPITRCRASSHYLRRSDKNVDTLKITFLIDTADRAILDVH